MKRKIGVGKVESWEKPSKTERSKRFKAEKIQLAFESENNVVVIPAKSEAETQNGKKLRVAAYCRVSTGEESQITSYEYQINYYRELIERNSDWELAGIYADKGLSGTAMNNRVELQRMLEDCRQGKIDRIITKAVERFSRNMRECLNTIDELLSLNPPVPITFETDNLDSARDRFENDLFFSSMVAQGEAIKRSRRIKWSYQVRFSKGIAMMPTHCILGYDKDVNGNIVIVKKEAQIIRFIYNSYLDGMCTSEIAVALTKAGIPTVMGSPVWRTGAVLSILRSEKYAGDAWMQKTYTPDCLSHKSVRNVEKVPMYFKKGHHIAIIPRGDWNETQRQLELRKYQRAKKLKPEKKLAIKRVKSGMFKGFSVVNPNWNNADAKEFLQQIIDERGNEDETV